MKTIGGFIIITSIVVFFSGCSSIPKIPQEELSKYALVRQSEGSVHIVKIGKIKVGMFDSSPINVKPGTYYMTVRVCRGTESTSCSDLDRDCNNVVAGYNYFATEKGCVNAGRRLDFPNADKYWADMDAEIMKTNSVFIKKAEEESARINKKKADNEDAKYHADKLALQNARTQNDLEIIIKSLEWRMEQGIHKDDPDGLLPLAKKTIEPFLMAEKRQQALINAARAKEDAAREKDESIRIANLQKQLVIFRKTLKEGDDTSCGLVIQRKGRLAKIQLASSKSEQWVKLDEVYPVGQNCSIVENGTAVNERINRASKGQKVCKTILIVSREIMGEAMGRPVYKKPVNRSAKITGFIEGASDSKYQIRISGMQSDGENVNHIDGDVVLDNGSVIWDESSNWSNCY